MNKLLLTTAMMAVFAVSSVQAQTYLKAGTKSEVPEYDTIDKTQLQSKIGLEAGLSAGEEITEDNLQRYGNDMVGNGMEPSISVQNDAVVMSNPEPMVPSTPPMADMGTQDQMNEPAVVVYDPVTQQQMMVEGQAVTEASVNPNPYPVVDETIVAPQTVTVETIAIGNTDTGVDMNQVQQLLQK